MNEWSAWMVWSWDMQPIVEAIFPEEIDALRYAVGLGNYAKVTRVFDGDLREQLK